MSMSAEEDIKDADFIEVGPTTAGTVVKATEGEGNGDGDDEDEDDGPDPVRDLAELVMQAVFEWNNDHEVVDAELPWLDLEAIAEETQRERLELLEFLKEQAGQERAAERAERADRVGATVAAYAEGGGDVDEATDDEQTPYRPSTEAANIFEPSFDAEDDVDQDEEQVDLEEPDARTAALARGQEFLYGFEASQLPREVLDAVEAAGEEMRRKAYASRLVAAISSEPYQDNLRLARQLRWSARVLVPTDEVGRSTTQSSWLDSVVTETNAGAVKDLVNITDTYSKASSNHLLYIYIYIYISARASTAGWCLWLMKTLRNRDEDVEGHLALDDETVGMMYDLRSQASARSKSDNSRMKVGARMFRKSIELEVFELDTGGLLNGTTSSQMGEHAKELGLRTLTLAGEMQPAHSRAYDLLRELTREVFDEMASTAYDKVVIDMGKEVSPSRRMLADQCPMTAPEVLKAIAQVSFYMAEPLVYLKTGEAGLTTETLQSAVDDLQLLNTVFLENPEFFKIYARESVVSELTNPAPAGTLKIGGRLLRRIMAMYRDDAVASSSLVLAEELSQRLYDADKSLPDVRRSWDNLMWNLELDDEDWQSEEFVKAAMEGVLASLVEKLIQSGMEKPTPETAEMCAQLGMGEEEMANAFSRVSGDIFEKALAGYLRDQGTGADGTPTVLFRSDPLTDEELQELKATAEKVGVSAPMALEVVAKELRVSLQNLVIRAGKSMRNNVAKKGAQIIQEANDLLDGLCTQLVEAFGGTDVTATLSIAGQLPSLDEYWASELCFKMADAVRDPEAAQAEAGIPGALTSTPEPEWEDQAQRILELLGLSGQR
ncbi:unnamed protein product [Ascophyllum nodosum]